MKRTLIAMALAAALAPAAGAQWVFPKYPRTPAEQAGFEHRLAARYGRPLTPDELDDLRKPRPDGERAGVEFGYWSAVTAPGDGPVHPFADVVRGDGWLCLAAPAAGLLLLLRSRMNKSK